MKNEQGLVTITMTPAQLDVIMCQLEGMWDVEARAEGYRSIGALKEMVEQGVRQWHPGYDYGEFGVDVVCIAPVYRQMLDAWQRVGATVGRNKGNEFGNVFEFARAVKAARFACGAEEVRHA